jgi:hypothetical protein
VKKFPLCIRGELERVIGKYTDEELGHAFREYIVEGNHSGWDGWYPWQKIGRGAIAFMRDLYLWFDNYR